MASNDAGILNAVADRLMNMGHQVTFLHEESFLSDESVIQSLSDYQFVLSMGRLSKTLALLQQLENTGLKVLNASVGVQNCNRYRFTHLLIEAGIPFPDSKIYCMSDTIDWNIFPCWVKKGEGYAEVADDVSYVCSKDELEERICQLHERNVSKVVLSAHLQGDLIKFYGVAGSSFFYWCYASGGHSKFGLEDINGPEQGYVFAEDKLRQLCDKAADVLHLDVYGGDCIVSRDGTIKMIDFNDWPSFSRCREQAADMIANIIQSNDDNK